MNNARIDRPPYARGETSRKAGYGKRSIATAPVLDSTTFGVVGGRCSKFDFNINVLREIGHDGGKNSLFFSLPCLLWPATRKCLAKREKLQRNFRSLMSMRNPG